MLPLLSWVVAFIYLVCAVLAGWRACAIGTMRRAWLALFLLGLALAADEVWNLHRVLSAEARALLPLPAPTRLAMWMGLGLGGVLVVAAVIRPIRRAAPRSGRLLFSLCAASLLVLLFARVADNVLAMAGHKVGTGIVGSAAKLTAALALAGALCAWRQAPERERERERERRRRFHETRPI